jgi:hypothetical protein
VIIRKLLERLPKLNLPELTHLLVGAGREALERLLRFLGVEPARVWLIHQSESAEHGDASDPFWQHRGHRVAVGGTGRDSEHVELAHVQGVEQAGQQRTPLGDGRHRHGVGSAVAGTRDADEVDAYPDRECLPFRGHRRAADESVVQDHRAPGTVALILQSITGDLVNGHRARPLSFLRSAEHGKQHHYSCADHSSAGVRLP